MKMMKVSHWVRQGRSSRVVASFLISALLLSGYFVTYADADSGIHPPPTTGPYGYNTFQPGAAGFPAVGGSYTDPVFGGVVRRMTDQTGHIDCNDIYAHHWANANGTYAFSDRLVDGFCSGPQIVNIATGVEVYTNQPSGLSTGENHWDAIDPDKYYYFSGSSLVRRNLAAQTNTVIKNFPGALQSAGKSLNIQDRTGRYFTVRYGGTNKVWDSQTDTIYSGSVTPVDPGNGWTAITPDGTYLVDTSGPAAQSYSYRIDHATQTIGAATQFWSLCGDHGAPISASNGKNYFVTFNCNNIPAVYRVDISLNEAGRTPTQQSADNQMLVPLTWNDAGHFSAVSTGSLSDWVFISIESPTLDAFGATPTNWTAYEQEIIAANVVTLEVRRLAHHRSRSIAVNYQTFPRVSSSWDGSVVLWVSNFNTSSPVGYADLYAIQFPLGAAQQSVLPPPSNLRVIQ
jgi:hypothetical protein